MIGEALAMKAVHIRLFNAPQGLWDAGAPCSAHSCLTQRIHCLPRCVLLQGWNCCPKPNLERGLMSQL